MCEVSSSDFGVWLLGLKMVKANLLEGVQGLLMDLVYLVENVMKDFWEGVQGFVVALLYLLDLLDAMVLESVCG